MAQSQGDRLIVARLPLRGVYIIEAVYPSGSFLPIAVKFSPDEDFGCQDAVITKYSENVFCLKLMPKKYSLDGFFKPVSQIRYRQGVTHTATLYYNGIYYIELENENSIYKRKIEEETENVTIKAESAGGGNFAAVYGQAGGKKYCLFFGCGEDYNETLYYADSCIIDKDITLKISCNDMCKNTKEIILSFDGKTFSEKSKKVTASLPVKNIDRLIPYYFLEAVLAENYELAISLLDNNSYGNTQAMQLKNFFGDYCEVLQNRYESAFAKYPAVKHKINDRLYRLKYYDFVVKDGLIENILEIS